MKGIKPDAIHLYVERVSITKISTAIGTEYSALETFTFENVSPLPVDIKFEISPNSRNKPIRVIESSIAPDNKDIAIWNITVPGNSKKILTTTTQWKGGGGSIKAQEYTIQRGGVYKSGFER